MPLLIGTSLFKAAVSVRRRSRPADAPANGDPGNGAPGSGPPQPITLQWQSLSCSLSNEKTGASKQLLSLDSGYATPGRLLAIMGPSGSGAKEQQDLPTPASKPSTDGPP